MKMTLRRSTNDREIPRRPWLLLALLFGAAGPLACGGTQSGPLDRCTATQPSLRRLEPTCYRDVDAGAASDAEARRD